MPATIKVRRGWAWALPAVLAALAGSLWGAGCGTRTAEPAPRPPHQIAAPRTPEELRAAVAAVVAAPELRPAYWGIHVVSLDRGDTLVGVNVEKAFRPASVLKLFTTAAALDILGPEYRFETRLVALGEVTENVLQGDLLVEASGDPTLGIAGGIPRDLALGPLHGWAGETRERDIWSVAGRLAIDDRAFDRETVSPYWEIGDLPFAYAAETSAFAYHENAIDFVLSAGEEAGAPARLEIDPNVGLPEIENSVRTVGKGGDTRIAWRRAPLDARLVFEGTIALDAQPYRGRAAVPGGARFAAECLRRAFAEVWIQIGGPTVFLSELGEEERAALEAAAVRRTILEHRSPELREIVRSIHKTSRNFPAEMLLKALGQARFGEGSVEAGERAVRAWLEERLGREPLLRMADGSGLSWRSLATPAETTALLRSVAEGGEGVFFRSTLPVAGVDGTLEHRLRDPPALGNVYAKTGYIAATRTLAGYVTARSGERLAFALFTNNYDVPTSRINQAHDRILELLAAFERKSP